MSDIIKKIEKKLIGIIDGKTCSSIETQKQIEDVLKYEIDIVENEESVLWESVYDNTNKEDRMLFNSILADRKMRVDEKKLMASRPRFAVCTIINDVCERIEFYEGHDSLEKTYDLRSKRLKNEKLKDYLEIDNNAYNPIWFLKQAGIVTDENEEEISDILNILHSSSEEELKEKAERYLKENNK